MSEMLDYSFWIVWTGSRYKVSIPNYEGGAVIPIKHYQDLLAERDALKAELEFHKQAALNFIDLSAELQKQRDALKAELAEEKWKHEDFEIAPCFICGYNGQGYYQPDTHPCASEYHRRREAKL